MNKNTLIIGGLIAGVAIWYFTKKKGTTLTVAPAPASEPKVFADKAEKPAANNFYGNSYSADGGFTKNYGSYMGKGYKKMDVPRQVGVSCSTCQKWDGYKCSPIATPACSRFLGMGNTVAVGA